MSASSMRRFFSVLVLSLFVAAPVVQVRCAMACVSEAPAESADACHLEQTTAPEGTPALASHHACREHAIGAAAALTSRVQTLDALPAPWDMPTNSSVTTPFAASSLVATRPAGPPGGLILPLRV